MRGIGTYVRGLGSELAAQTAFPIEFWGWEGPCPIDLSAPHGWLTVPRGRSPRYRGAWLFARRAMRRRARLSPVSIVHVNDPDGLVTLPGKRMVATVYDLVPLREGFPTRQLLNRLGYRGYLGSLSRCEQVLAISHQTAADVVERLLIPPARVAEAPPGLRPPLVSGDGPRPERPFFLYVGGPNPNKNLGCLLEAMALAAEVPEELLIVGAWLPRDHQGLEEEVRRRGLARRVRHLGYVPDEEVARLMAASTAVVVPSRSEGFGLPAAEAMAAGTLVIHSRIPVLESVMAGTGLSFDPGSPQELAGRLRKAASMGEVERGELIQKGRLRAQALTWDAAVRVTLEAYGRLLSEAS